MVQTNVLHISDTHLGLCQYGSDVRSDCFREAIDVAVQRDVDAVIHTGDLFDDPRPALPTVTRCADVLDTATDRDMPIYGIVGNHDRRDDEQWLDLLRRTNAVARLGREPRIVGDTALYGIGSVRPGDWQSTDFTLAQPPPGVECTILCMHELLEPPGDGAVAHYPIEDVLDRVGIDLDGLALGGLHQPRSARVDGTDVWYAGTTERFGTDDTAPGVVQLLEIDGGTITRQRLELETRPHALTSAKGTDLAGVRDALDRHDLAHAVGTAELVLEGGAVASNKVSRMARDGSAADVDVEDNDGHPVGGGREMLRTARNAVETAALLGFRRRSGRGTGAGSDEPEYDQDGKYDRRT